MNNVFLNVVVFSMAAIQCLGGAAIYANNFDSNRPLYLDKGVAPVFGTWLQSTWLQFATMEGKPIGDTFGLAAPGFFDNGFFEVPGASNNAFVSFKLRAWVGTNGSSFATANCKCEATIRQKAGSFTPSGMPNPVALNMPNGLSMRVRYTPKPLTSILVGVALIIVIAELLWMCRRKR